MTSNKSLLWDSTLPSLELVGKGSRDFLHGQTTADLLIEDEKSFIHCCWLTPTGNVRALLEIRLKQGGAEVLILAGNAEELSNGFKDVIFPADKVRVEPLKMVRRVQILGSCEVGGRFNQATWLLPTEPLSNAFKSFQLLNPFQFECWRIEEGLPLGPEEINGKSNPFELGLSDLLTPNKGCYLGQETIAKLSRFGHLKQQLRYWEAEGEAEVLTGQKLKKPFDEKESEREYGVITSVITDLSLRKSYGLAMIRRQALCEEHLLLEDGFTKVKIKTPSSFVALPS